MPVRMRSHCYLKNSLQLIGKMRGISQAVIEVGPLLKNLLLARPLPHWQHPPPLVNSGDIPPVINSPCLSQPLPQTHPLTLEREVIRFCLIFLNVLSSIKKWRFTLVAQETY
ncbi:formin-like protein [Cucumis melo var. makuwa]|uniref:Formin-like protein n=1 Tax=Cucumis melo var. makuwa TaxID=1194695 RepID=A0A5D3CYG3_CUCMM|nr:formin-like protein [Cucumis melo var. makuwa]TYK15994.1 formin-like protein [Cucumis melo var. makuwa]